MTNQIWQVQEGAADGTQATAGDANTIKFSLSTVNADNNLYGADITLRNSTPENTNIEGDENEIEDMGIDGVDIKVTSQFRDKEADINKLVDWWLDDKFTDVAPKGRFGFELNFPTRFNVEPTSLFGYLLVNPTLSILYEKKNIVGSIFTLRLANPKGALSL